MQWIKIYAGMATDPKFRLIAKDTRTHVGDALGVWLMLLEEAAKADGDAWRFNPRLSDLALNLKEGKSQAIIEAMRDLGMLDGLRVTAWEARQGQPGQPASNAYERVRRYRQKHASDNAAVTHDNAAVTHDNGNDNAAVTHDNGNDNAAVTHDNGVVTHDNAVKEKIKNRIEKKDIPPKAPPEGDVCEDAPFEFQELRAIWDQEMRAEGPLIGLIAWKAAVKARVWPGLGQIRADIARRKDAGCWSPGYAPGLEKYLEGRVWQCKIVPRPQARSLGQQSEDAFRSWAAQPEEQVA